MVRIPSGHGQRGIQLTEQEQSMRTALAPETGRSPFIPFIAIIATSITSIITSIIITTTTTTNFTPPPPPPTTISEGKVLIIIDGW